MKSRQVLRTRRSRAGGEEERVVQQRTASSLCGNDTSGSAPVSGEEGEHPPRTTAWAPEDPESGSVRIRSPCYARLEGRTGLGLALKRRGVHRTTAVVRSSFPPRGSARAVGWGFAAPFPRFVSALVWWSSKVDGMGMGEVGKGLERGEMRDSGTSGENRSRVGAFSLFLPSGLGGMPISSLQLPMDSLEIPWGWRRSTAARRMPVRLSDALEKRPGKCRSRSEGRVLAYGHHESTPRNWPRLRHERGRGPKA
ncbi:hypothetical protein JHW43_000959 [Diplocarpon mali]|nr:hypothetical protein JHW43_000959 [Diplocarpon mali]